MSPNKKYSGLGIKGKEFIHKCLLYKIFKVPEGVNMVQRYAVLPSIVQSNQEIGTEKNKQTNEKPH